MTNLLIRGLSKPKGTKKISIIFYLEDGSIEGIDEIWDIEAEEMSDLQYNAFRDFQSLLIKKIEDTILYGEKMDE